MRERGRKKRQINTKTERDERKKKRQTDKHNGCKVA